MSKMKVSLFIFLVVSHYVPLLVIKKERLQFDKDSYSSDQETLKRILSPILIE